MTRKSRTRFYRKLEHYLKSSGEGTTYQIDRVQNISEQEFLQKYVKKGIPVILDSAAKDWKCVKEWSLDYFKDLHGDDEIIFMDQTDIAKGYESTTLGKVIDQMKKGVNKYYRFYPLLEKHPEHLLDFDYEWIRNRKLKGNYGEAFHVFLSPPGGFTPIHNASSHNIFFQSHGEKRWFLYPVDYTCVIDPAPARNFYRSAPIRNGVDFNPFKNNFDDYKLYKYIDRYEVHLTAGDVFYNPPYTWHCVQNPTESIGVGYRYFTPLKTFARTPLYFFLELFAFHPPFWKTWNNYSDVNLLHLAETGKLKEIKKERGVKKIKSSVS
ncbi:MAG: cupin-like domain-containing protein [Flavobacteriaceae bacterium]|nr:cupin-like domain-containing protein [Flavobacteriaceae bacterium]